MGIRHISSNNHSNLINNSLSIQAFNKSKKVNLDSMMLNKEDLGILHIIKVIRILILDRILTPMIIDKITIHFNIRIKLKAILDNITIADNHRINLEDQIILHLNQELNFK